MSSGALIIRADASVAMGTGHVMRCLALAQAWQDAGRSSIFAMAETTPAVEQRVAAEKFERFQITSSAASRQDAEELAKLAGTYHGEWVVVDGYQFDVEYQRVLKAAGLKVLVIDDGGQCGGYCADFVVDQGFGASEEDYKNREPYTQLMLGTRFVMLRQEFGSWRTWQRESPTVGQRLLVTIGGSDPDGLTARVIEALPAIGSPGLAATIVAGGSNPCLTELQQLADNSPLKVDLLRDPASMPRLMAQSDLAVICAGGTLWELLYMGCASLSYARDAVQGDVIARLHAMGAVRDLGPVIKFNVSEFADAVSELVASRRRREEMAKIGRTIVDGEGAKRVLQRLQGVTGDTN